MNLNICVTLQISKQWKLQSIEQQQNEMEAKKKAKEEARKVTGKRIKKCNVVDTCQNNKTQCQYSFDLIMFLQRKESRLKRATRNPCRM